MSNNYKLNYFFAINLKSHILADKIEQNFVNILKKDLEIKENLKFINREKLHITIFYIGHIADENLQNYIKSFKTFFLNTKKFNISLNSKNIRIFKKRKDSPVVILINDDENILKKLHYSIRKKTIQILKDDYIDKEKRDFLAHLTFARTKNNFEKKTELLIKKNYEIFVEDLNKSKKNIFSFDEIELLYLDPISKLYKSIAI